MRVKVGIYASTRGRVFFIGEEGGDLATLLVESAVSQEPEVWEGSHEE